MADNPIYYTVLNPDRTIKYANFTTDGSYEPTNGEILVKDEIPSWDPKYQRLIRLDPVPEGSNSVVYVIETMTDEEKQQVDIQEIRGIRNKKLSDSDWIILPDSPFSDAEKSQWASYRQLLRDLPEQEGFPDPNLIVWPQKPGDYSPGGE